MKKVRFIALFIVLIGLSLAWSEVKLRIYMKDGTLQAGNMISEGAQAFVILTKDGRVEVPKSQIMFVNGKTLAQWESQPTRSYQTEIIPTDVPNPAYVNDKSAPPPPIQPYSPIKGVIPNGEEVKRTPKATTPKSVPKSTPTPVETQEPVEEENTDLDNAGSEEPAGDDDPAVEEPATDVAGSNDTKPTSEDAITDKPTRSTSMRGTQASAESRSVGKAKSVSNTQKPAPSHGRAHAKPAGLQTAAMAVPAAGVVAAAALKRESPKPAMSDVKYFEKPTGFNRDALAEYHYNQGMEFLAHGLTGQGLQEIHKAHVLNRGADKTAIILGKTYFAQGVFLKSEKFLKNPMLKKNDEAQKMLSDISKAMKSQKQKPWILGGASAGAFIVLLIPFFWLERRFLRKPRVIESQAEMDQFVTSTHEAADVPPSEAKIETETASVGVVEASPADTAKSAPVEPVRAAETPAVPEAKPVEPKPSTPAAPLGPPPTLKPKPVEPLAPLAVPKTPEVAPIQPPVIGEPPKVEPAKVEPAEAEPAIAASKPPEPKAPDTSSPPPVKKDLPPLSPTTEDLIKKLERDVPPPQVTHEPPISLPEPVTAQSQTPATTSSVPPTSVPPTYLSPAAPKEPVLDTEALLERASLVDFAIQRANEFASANEFVKAEREYRTALALNPDCVEGFIGLGFVCFMHGQWEMALEFYVKALSINPNSADAHYGIGRVLLETHRETEAVPELQKALTLDPTFVDARDTLTYLGKVA